MEKKCEPCGLVAVIGDLAGNVDHATNTITLTIVTNATYGYDDAGNVTNISYNSGAQELDLGWNAQYQLTAATNGTEVDAYAYDALGRRVATVTGTTTNYHVYDGIHCVADVNATGAVLRSYTYGPGIDNILAMTVHGASEDETYYYLTDHLGSVLAITDTNGAVVETYDYDAWGRVQVYDAENLPLSASGIGNRFAFQGREVSWATGLYYFRARWYDPVSGRWLSKDPIGISGGLNQYVAFAGNPVNARDALGQNAYVVNHGGYTGHTAFIVDNSSGGVTIYHYFAAGHHGAPGSQSLKGFVYDNASVWSETRNSIGDYINEQTSPVSIDGIAIGTDRDDAQMIAYLDIEDADDDDYYSILGMKECHSMSWNWFWSYARAGNNMIALPKLQIWNDNPDLRGVGLPDRAYLTPDFAMPKFTPFSK